jgi:hypothetical protein
LQVVLMRRQALAPVFAQLVVRVQVLARQVQVRLAQLAKPKLVALALVAQLVPALVRLVLNQFCR